MSDPKLKDKEKVYVGDKESDFEVPKPPPPPPPNQIGNVVLPPEMGVAPMPDPNMTVGKDGSDLVAKWMAHQEKRNQMMRDGMSSSEVDKAGYRAMTFVDFKKKYREKNPPSTEETEARHENKMKRMAALRLAKDIEAYHNQGEVANTRGFNLGKKPSILKVETDGLSSELFMFSPEW